MADYYPLLAKAVAGLPNSTPETRRAIYERARAALIGQLRRMDPPVPETVLDREAESLEAAVARLEAEMTPAAEATTPAGPAAEPSPGDAAAIAEPAGAPSPPPLAQAEAPERAAATLAGPQSAPPPQDPTPPAITDRPQARRASEPDANSGAPSRSGARTARPPIASPMPRSPMIRNGAPALDAAPEPMAGRGPSAMRGVQGSAPRSAAAGAPVFGEPVAPAPVVEQPFGAPGLGAQSEPAAETPQAAAKLRPDAQRPFAPQPARETAAPKRLWIVASIVGVFILLVAIAAFKLRDRPEDLAGLKQPAPSAPAESGPSGKIVDRIGGGAAAEPPASGGTAADHADVGKSAIEPGDPGQSVARRAALLVEAPEEESKVKTYLGTVVWRVDNVSNGSDEPLGTAVRADIEIPEEKLRAEMTLQKNLDATLSASHTMKLNFIPAPGGPLPDIQQISVPQMRREDTATGKALSGGAVPITPNVFLVGLDRGAAEATNLDLLRSRDWIDVPIVLSNGRVAKLTFEKGASGQRALEEALESWQAQ